MEEKEVYKRASTSSRLKNTGLQKKMNPENRPYYPHQDSSPLPNHDNENFYESPGESYVDDFGSDEGASCPYTDINGQCSQEPVVTETDGEEPVEGAPPQSGGEYYKYLNEQTFDSLRAPASEDEY